MGEDKITSQQVEKDNFITLCNNGYVESPKPILNPAPATGITCTDLEIVSSTEDATGRADEIILLTIFGLETDVNAFIAAVQTSGLDMKVYGEYSVYMTGSPTTSPVVAPETTLSEADMFKADDEILRAAALALCHEFELAGADGALYSDVETDLSCVTKTTIATNEEKDQFHRDVDLFTPIWVYSSTEQASEALAQQLRDLHYRTVTSLGGLDGSVGPCVCTSVAMVTVESAEYANEVAGSVVMAILALISCCIVCLCVFKRKEYYPVEETVLAVKTTDVESGAVEAKGADFVETRIYQDKWIPADMSGSTSV